MRFETDSKIGTEEASASVDDAFSGNSIRQFRLDEMTDADTGK